MQITWLGHSGFRIEIEGAVLLIDPWLAGNPSFPAEQRAKALAGATHVLLSHAHGDHASDTVAISKELGIAVVCGHELATWLGAAHGCKTLGFGKGGTVDLNGAKVTMVNASHSNSIDFREGGLGVAGSEAGFMIAGEGRTIYFAGDTDIMADMDWMGDLHKPDIGILPIGGHYTMDGTRAAYACRRYFRFDTVIPCHFKTFPLLAQDANDLRAGVPVGTRVLEPEVMVPVAM